MITFLLWFNYAVFLYFVAINSFYIFLVVLGYIGIRRQRRNAFLLESEQIVQSPYVRPVSLIAPAYNEEASIVDSVASLLQLRYPLYEVIVVNDGSKDETLKAVVEAYDMVPSRLLYRHQIPCNPIKAIYVSPKYPQLIVVDKVNGKKADAINAGINVSRYPLFCAMDADSLLEKDALLKSMRPFFEDPTTLCVGGSLRVVNGCTVVRGDVTEVRAPSNYLACCQALEYLRSFLYGRVGWDELDATLIISGAFGVFNKQAVIAAGGFDVNSVGEDMELVVRLRRWGYQHMERHRVRFVAETVCWTQVPEDLTIFKRQRARWMRGLMQTLWKHKGMVFNPRYRTVGLVAMPFFVLFEMLGPVVETVGYIVFILCWAFGLLNWEFAFWFLMVSVFLGTVLSIGSVLLMELTERRYGKLRDVLKLLGFCVLDNFGYRQVHSFFRMLGLFEYLKGKKGWGEMNKTGFGNKPPAPSTLQ